MSCVVPRKLQDFSSCGVQQEQAPKAKTLNRGEYVNIACCCPWKGQPLKLETREFCLDL